MKQLVWLGIAVLAATVLHAEANGDQGEGDGGKSVLGLGITAGLCKCRNGFWGTCQLNVGTRTIGCRDTNRFLQCVEQTCSGQTCPGGQVWNSTAQECSACATGTHITSDLQRCSCDQGTTSDWRDIGTCTACPTDSIGWTTDNDQCYCNPATHALDSITNACRACPANSTLKRSALLSTLTSCSCSGDLFWSATSWQCLPCPGVWESQSRWWWPWWPVKSVCRCEGTNTIFDRRTVSCYTCPAGTTASSLGDLDTCLCPLRGQSFDDVTGACVCTRGSTLNAAGTACVFTTVVAQTPTPSTPPRAP